MSLALRRRGILETGSPRYVDVVLSDSPLAFWPLNNTTTPYNDLSGNGYHGTPGASGAAPTPANTGGPDPALGKVGFDGGDHALMTTVGSFGAGLLGTWTFEIWVKTSSKVYNVVSGAVNSGTNVIFDVVINGAQNGDGSTLADNHCVFIRHNSNRSFVWSFTSATLTDGNWHHLVWTATDFAGSGVVAYMDGVNMSATQTRNATANTVQDLGFPLAIGGRNVRGTITAQITGDLAYGALYLTALSSGRVAAHYNAMFP